MKMSIIVRYVSQVIFWFNCILFFGWFFTQDNSPWILLLMTALLILAGFFSRKLKNRVFVLLTHFCMAAIPGVFWAANKMTLMIFIFAVGIIVVSLISKYAESDFMNRANAFGNFVLVVIYLVGAVMGYKYEAVLFGCMFAYFFLEFVQVNFEKNEEYVDNLNYTSIVDVSKTKSMANLMTLITALIMAAGCGIITLVGVLPPVARLSAWMRSRIKDFMSFLKRVQLKPDDKEPVVEDVLIPGQTDDVTQFEDIIEKTSTDDIVFIVAIVVVIAAVIFMVYMGIRQLYRYYLKLQKMGLLDEEVSIKKDKASKKKINPKDSDASYSNRAALRRIYKKRIKGGKRGKREDFINRTPYEQRDKSMTEGNVVSTEFVDMYERARYSNEAVTKEDVKRMNSME